MAMSTTTSSPKQNSIRTTDDGGEGANGSLLIGLMDGQREAAFEFCDKYGPRINRWVWRLMGADDEHDELVQQVYVGLFSSLPKLKNVDALDAFVDSVAIRTVRKEIRRRKYRKMFFGSATNLDVDQTPHGQSGFKDAHIRAFYRIVNELDADERVVFILKHIEGLTLIQIAKISGYSLRTAKRRLYSAMAKLKDKMMTEPILITLLEEF